MENVQDANIELTEMQEWYGHFVIAAIDNFEIDDDYEFSMDHLNEVEPLFNNGMSPCEAAAFIFQRNEKNFTH